MDAALDLLLTAVYVTADDLLPEGAKNAKRSATDADVVTLCVAQFPRIPGQAATSKRRRLSDTLEWLMSVFASQSPGF